MVESCDPEQKANYIGVQTNTCTGRKLTKCNVMLLFIWRTFIQVFKQLIKCTGLAAANL